MCAHGMLCYHKPVSVSIRILVGLRLPSKVGVMNLLLMVCCAIMNLYPLLFVSPRGFAFAVEGGGDGILYSLVFESSWVCVCRRRWG